MKISLCNEVVRELSRWHPARRRWPTPGPPGNQSAQTLRAVLFASATAATLQGFWRRDRPTPRAGIVRPARGLPQHRLVDEHPGAGA